MYECIHTYIYIYIYRRLEKYKDNPPGRRRNEKSEKGETGPEWHKHAVQPRIGSPQIWNAIFSWGDKTGGLSLFKDTPTTYLYVYIQYLYLLYIHIHIYIWKKISLINASHKIMNIHELYFKSNTVKTWCVYTYIHMCTYININILCPRWSNPTPSSHLASGPPSRAASSS